MKKEKFSSSMKARLIALVILLVLIGVPIGLYWYFMQKNISSLEIGFGSGITAQVELRGTFSASFLPLADKMLSYTQTCESVCTFSPIPPALYTVHITSEGMMPTEAVFSLKTNEKQHHQFILNRALALTPITPPSRLSPDEIILLQDTIQEKNPGVTVIGGDFSGRIWAYRTMGQGVQIGSINSDDSFIPLKNFPSYFSHIELDPYGRSLVAYRDAQHALLMTLDFAEILETMLPQPIKNAYFSQQWHITTIGGGYDFLNGSWQKNPRFTDWYDYDGRWRVGYIDKGDTEKLAISNYTPDAGSQLLMIDRTNGEVYSLAEKMDIANIFSFSGNIVVQDTRGGYYSFDLPTR